jgi:hypothetical protein
MRTTLALRSTAAPGRKVGAGSGFARAAGVVALGCHERTCVVPSQRALRLSLRPNPSIEGTSTIRLRLLAAAPHVKR